MKKKRNIQKEDNFNLDKLLSDNNLNYSDINFNKSDSDVLRSYLSLNKKLNYSSFHFKNIRAIFTNINFKPILKPVYTIILTSIVIFSVFEYKDLVKPVQYVEVEVKKGEKINLHVTENFTIYLNSESKIKIPLELKRNSKIYFEGEALFEIDQNKKFTVIADGINLTGEKCSFYINSKNPEQFITNVSKGELAFYNPKFPEATKLMLSEGKKAFYIPKAGFAGTEDIEDSNYLAWHTGVLNFENTPFDEVVNTLSNLFEIPIEVTSDKLSGLQLTAQYKNLEIDNILDKIQSTFNCNITADGSKILIN